MSVSIFKDARVDLKDALSSCEPGEILYASIDIAKYYHSAMAVNFFGDVIIPKFDFPYNNHGIDFLRKKLGIAQKQTQAKKLFLGLESTGHYHENLAASLIASGYDVQVIRPIDSKHERDNVHAKTDAIDLAAIVRVIISNKGTRSHIPDAIYYNLQRASRTHRQLTQIALSLNAHCPEYHLYYSKKRFQYKDAPKKAKTATANRFIKLAFALMKNETLYYPSIVNPLKTQYD